jgi:hypothetical protein
MNKLKINHMKRNIKVKEKELIDRLNAAANPVMGIDTAEGEDKTAVTVYKDGTPVKHYEGNDEWKNDYFSGKTVVENQIDLDPVKNMTEDEKEKFNTMGPCSLEDIHRDSIEDAKESRASNNDILDVSKKLFPHVVSERERRLSDILRGVAVNAEKKETRSRTYEKPEATAVDYEEVNHPQHYNNYDVEVIDMMERIFGKEETAIFCKLNAFKYRQRMGNKPGQDINKDLAKERWYLNKKKELES